VPKNIFVGGGLGPVWVKLFPSVYMYGPCVGLVVGAVSFNDPFHFASLDVCELCFGGGLAATE
jgi:hypothetical protein